MPHTTDKNAEIWPAARMANGFLDLGAILSDDQRSRITAKCEVQHGVLTLWGRSAHHEKGYNVKLLQVQLKEVVIKVFPRHDNMFVLGHGSTSDLDVYAFTKDQTARKKWVAGTERHCDLANTKRCSPSTSQWPFCETVVVNIVRVFGRLGADNACCVHYFFRS
jgi:hypothetical protein